MYSLFFGGFIGAWHAWVSSVNQKNVLAKINSGREVLTRSGYIINCILITQRSFIRYGTQHMQLLYIQVVGHTIT